MAEVKEPKKYTGEEKRKRERQQDEEKWTEDDRDKFRRNVHKLRPYIEHFKHELGKSSNGIEKPKVKSRGGLPLIGDLLE